MVMDKCRRSAGFIGALAVLAVLAGTAAAAPAQVIIIRHGEKPATGNELLVPQGVCRADELAKTFPAQFGTPVAIYAMNPNDEDGSLRPIETVTPLANALGLTIKHDYTRKKFSQLVQDIMGNETYQGKLVLICWEHKVIPDLVQAFQDGGWSANSATWPSKWSGDIFDQAWILNFAGNPSFQIIPENIPLDSLNGNCPLSDVQSSQSSGGVNP
jgi:hypothetical protein